MVTKYLAISFPFSSVMVSGSSRQFNSLSTENNLRRTRHLVFTNPVI